MNDYLFILGDGDDTRRKVEEHLLSGDLKGLGEFSGALKRAIEHVANIAATSMSAVVVFAGGDDILFTVRKERYDEQKVKKLMDQFAEHAGAPISFGVGPSVESAYVNLRRAKSRGAGTLVACPELMHSDG